MALLRPINGNEGRKRAALLVICQTQATHSDRSLDITDSGGNVDRSTRKTAGTRVFFTAAFLATVFLATVFLATGFFLTAIFFAAAFFTGFAARFFDPVAMLHVYQN